MALGKSLMLLGLTVSRRKPSLRTRKRKRLLYQRLARRVIIITEEGMGGGGEEPEELEGSAGKPLLRLLRALVKARVQQQ